jgi:NodT family efflux transporter outer membrane factor (OMF) lipoprotein
MPRCGLATLAAVAVLAGPVAAAARPDPPPPHVDMPASYLEARPSASLPPAALDHWWLLFNDPTLDALEDEAFRTAPDTLTAAARLVEAHETLGAQTAATYPSGSITGDASHQQAYGIGSPAYDLNPTGGVTDTVDGRFNVSWELDLFGRYRVERRIARADAAEARFNVEGTLAELAADVADGYFLAQGLVIQLENARQTTRIEHDLLNVARRKELAGAGPTVDVDRVAGDVAQSESRVDDLQAQLDAARRRLLILVGRDLRKIDDLPLSGTTPDVPPTPRALPSELLARRPDIREAEYRLLAERGSARLAHLAIFPTITLLPGLGVSRISEPTVSFIPPTTLITTQQTTSSGFWSLAAGVTVPTLDIPKLLYQAKSQDAQVREDAIAYEKTVRTAFGEVQIALTDLAASEHATDLLADGEAHAHRAYDGTRRGYAQGLDDLTTTLSAEESWRSILTSLTIQRVESLRRAVRTYKALGGGWAFSNMHGGG